jgi:hypothetical protein
MSYGVKPMPWVMMAVFAGLLLGAPLHQAAARVASCRITTAGSSTGEGFRCSHHPSQTRKVTGQPAGMYEVDFLILNATPLVMHSM